MNEARQVWKRIQSLSEIDRTWLFAQLVDRPPFQQSFPASRQPAGQPGESTVMFDGGSRGNPGPGYGSYALCVGDGVRQVTHMDFREHMTNNEAEYEALIRALEDLRGRLSALGYHPGQHDVMVLGDSQLVINQVTGAWKARDPRMLQRRDRVRRLLSSFGRVTFERKGRAEIEEVLGH